MEVIRVVQMVPETLILKLVAEKDVPKYQANRRASKYTYMTFFTFSRLIWLFVLFIFYINIIYFVMTYFIISDALILIYFIICIGKPNKTNGQTWYLKVKSVIYFGMEGVYVYVM